MPSLSASRSLNFSPMAVSAAESSLSTFRSISSTRAETSSAILSVKEASSLEWRLASCSSSRIFFNSIGDGANESSS